MSALRKDRYVLDGSSVLGMARDEAAADRIVDALAAAETHELFYIQLADDGTAIRKWSRTPFEGARKCRVALDAHTETAKPVSDDGTCTKEPLS